MNSSRPLFARFARGTALLILGTATLVIAYAVPVESGGLLWQGSGLRWGLSISGVLLVSTAVLALMGAPWRKRSRTAIGAAALAHGFLGVAGVLLAGWLEGIVAASLLSVAGFEFVVAVLCVRALLRRRTEIKAQHVSQNPAIKGPSPSAPSLP